MPIPLWGVSATGATLHQLDDPSTGADTVGGVANAYVATLVTSPFSGGPGTYSDLRRMVVNIETPAAVTLTLQAMRDKQAAGVVMTRTVNPVESRDTILPQKVSGTEFQESLTVSGWSQSTAPSASIGLCSANLIVRRSERGGDDT